MISMGKKDIFIFGLVVLTFAFVLSSGCIGAGGENKLNETAAQPENETGDILGAAIGDVAEKTNETMETEPEDTINLTLKIYSNFEAAEINGLRSLELDISKITIKSDGEITLLGPRTIELKDTKTKLTVATLEIPASNYRAVDLAVAGAAGTFELSSSIPGILAQIQKKGVIIKSGERTISLNRQINESVHLTIRFNVGNVSFSKPTFDNTLTSIELTTYPSCDTNCNAQCTKEGSFESCYGSCVQNGNAICNGNAVDACNIRCNCPNSDCTYTKDEECRSACIRTEQDGSTECKTDLTSSCPALCKEKAEYLTCMKNCKSRC